MASVPWGLVAATSTVGIHWTGVLSEKIATLENSLPSLLCAYLSDKNINMNEAEPGSTTLPPYLTDNADDACPRREVAIARTKPNQWLPPECLEKLSSLLDQSKEKEACLDLIICQVSNA